MHCLLLRRRLLHQLQQIVSLSTDDLLDDHPLGVPDSIRPVRIAFDPSPAFLDRVVSVDHDTAGHAVMLFSWSLALGRVMGVLVIHKGASEHWCQRDLGCSREGGRELTYVLFQPSCLPLKP